MSRIDLLIGEVGGTVLILSATIRLRGGDNVDECDIGRICVTGNRLRAVPLVSMYDRSDRPTSTIANRIMPVLIVGRSHRIVTFLEPRNLLNFGNIIHLRIYVC